MGFYPYDATPAKPLQAEGGKALDGLSLGVVAFYEIAPAASGSAGILEMTTTAASAVLTTGFNQPDVPRALEVIGSATATAGSVVLHGTDIADEAISETLYCSGSASAVAGSKAFKTLTSITWPGGSSGSIAVGTTKKFGIPHLVESGSALALKQVFDNLADAGAFAYDSGSLCANTYTPAGTPNGVKKLKLVYLVE